MADIVLKNRNGEKIDYPGIDYLNVKTPDGETRGFAAYDPETLVPKNLASGVVVGDVEGALKVPQAVETTIDPDFSAGDMEVVPGAGEVFSKVGILKPANLTPENIAEGVDIAGIIGTLAASGGSGAVVKFGEINPQGEACTITHELGVLPDIFFVYHGTSPIGNTGIIFDIRYSSAFIEKMALPYAGKTAWFKNTSNHLDYVNQSTDRSLEATVAFGLNSATSETIQLSAASGYEPMIARYYWIAVGGLT